MQRLFLVLAGLVWSGLVFLLAFWLTFPSGALTERLRWEVHQASNGDLALELDGVGPWWIGVRADGVRLYSNSLDRRTGETTSELSFFAESLRIALSPFSALRGAPRVSGSIDLGSSDIAYDLSTAMNKRGTSLEIVALDLQAPAVEVADLVALAGSDAELHGPLAVQVNLAGEEGLRTADGLVSITGSDLVITALGGDLPALGFEIPLTAVALEVVFERGRGTVKTGSLQSTLAEVEVTGEVMLREDPSRSTIRLPIIVDKLNPPAGMEMLVTSLLASARWGDGKYHFLCSGSLAMPRCDIERERGVSSSSMGSSGRSPSRPSYGGRSPGGYGPGSTTGGSTGTVYPSPGQTGSANNGVTSTAPSTTSELSLEERRERLRKMREEREAALRRDQPSAADEDPMEGLGEPLENLGYGDNEEGGDDFWTSEKGWDDMEAVGEDEF